MVKTGARRQQCLRLFLCPDFIMLLPQRFHDASSTQPLTCVYSVGASRIDLDQREESRKGEWMGWWEEICVDMETRRCTRPGGVCADLIESRALNSSMQGGVNCRKARNFGI